MESYSAEILLSLIPNYHQKKADVIIMFFRMNNIDIFERCRQTREKFETYIQTPSFQTTFLQQFFHLTGNDITFLQEKYNQVALYTTIELAKVLLEPFLGFTMNGGRKIKGKTYKKKHSSLWRYLQKGGMNALVTAANTNEAISQFLQKTPYNGFIGVEDMESVTRLLLSRIFKKEQLSKWQGNKSAMTSILLLCFLAQEIVPLMMPYELILQEIVSEKNALQNGGQQSQEISITSSGVTNIFKNERTEIENLRLFLTLATPLRGNINDMESFYEVTDGAKGMSTLLMERANRNLSYINKTRRGGGGLRDLLKALAAGLLQTYSGVSLKAPNYKQQLMNRINEQERSRFTYGNNVRPSNNKELIPPGYKFNNQGLSLNMLVMGQQITTTSEQNAKQCLVSSTIDEVLEGDTTGFLDPEFIKAVRSIHAISATNEETPEFSLYLVLDEATGMLRPNATVGTIHKRGATCVPGWVKGINPKESCQYEATITENSAMFWHLHPWEIDSRFNSHQSEPDLMLVLKQALYHKVPYGAANAPEGLYVYSLQKSTLDFIKSNPSIKYLIGYDIQNFLDKKMKSQSGSLSCKDLRTRNIDTFKNLGEIQIKDSTDKMVSVPIGFDIRFYNQESLSKGEKIALPYYDIFKSEVPAFPKEGPKIAAQPGLDGNEFWNLVSNALEPTNPEMKALNPFSESKNPTKNMNTLSQKILVDLKEFEKFQNAKIERYSKIIKPKKANIYIKQINAYKKKEGKNMSNKQKNELWEKIKVKNDTVSKVLNQIEAPIKQEFIEAAGAGNPLGKALNSLLSFFKFSNT